MDSYPQQDVKQRRLQALRLTEAVFRKMTPTPVVPVERVAPIVYDLLVDGVEVAQIELALREARAHTRAGIDYAIRSVAPREHGHGMKPHMPPVALSPPFNPSAEQRAAARDIIAETRRKLRGG